MNINNKIKKIDFITIFIISIIILLLIVLNSLSYKKSDNSIKSKEDAGHSEISVMTGSSAENAARQLFPDAEIKTFNLNSDSLYAVETGNVKYGMALEYAILDYNKKRSGGLEIVGDPLYESYTGIFFARSEKNKSILPLFNEFVEDLRTSGKLEKLDDKWFKETEEINNFDIDNLDNKNGTIICAIDAAYPPYTYIYNNGPVGFDIEIVYEFCKKYGYGLDIKPVDFNGMLTGVKAGKFDIGAGGNTITEERKKSVDFSVPLRKNRMCLYTKAEKPASLGSDNFINEFKDSFHKTFIVEDRYKLFIEGLCSTLFMSASAIILGTLISFIICLLRLSGSVILNKICNIYVSILQGVPILVVLLLFYYIIFRSSNIRGEIIATIAFALNFSAYVSEMLMTSIKSIDKGQWEAAFALGFGYWTTFFKFILRQALVSTIPVYKGEVISLIKSTSIVGYIAVQDLTKMSDIVRSRTFEPFIPILSVALVYYIFSFIISNILSVVLFKVDRVKKAIK